MQFDEIKHVTKKETGCQDNMKQRLYTLIGAVIMLFNDFSFNDFWNDSEYAKEAYISEYPAGDLIEKIEKELGYKLPESYIWLMKQHNGGIPTDTCFPIDEPTSWSEDHIAISGVMGIGIEKPNTIGGEFGSRFMIEEWGYPDIGVAICDCPSAGHDMVFLDYRGCGPSGEPEVVHIDQEQGYKITFLADNFEAFIRGLVNEEVFDSSEEDKADDLKMVRSALFSPLLSSLCEQSDCPQATEQWIRRIAEAIVEEKGFFALHADERSMLLYDIQFWLYTNAYPNTTEEQYLADYQNMIAFGGSFCTGGYAKALMTDWLEQRKAAGAIVEKNNCIAFTMEAQQLLLREREK